MDRAEEKYSRGRRGAPAKGVGRATGARVRIPLSPFCLKITFEKNFKKVIDKQEDIWSYIRVAAWEIQKKQQKIIKKVVDKHETLWYNIKAVAWNGNNKKNIDNWTIDNKPWKFLQEIFQERTSKDVEPEQ